MRYMDNNDTATGFWCIPAVVGFLIGLLSTGDALSAALTEIVIGLGLLLLAAGAIVVAVRILIGPREHDDQPARTRPRPAPRPKRRIENCIQRLIEQIEAAKDELSDAEYLAVMDALEEYCHSRHT